MHARYECGAHQHHRPPVGADRASAQRCVTGGTLRSRLRRKDRIETSAHAAGGRTRAVNTTPFPSTRPTDATSFRHSEQYRSLITTLTMKPFRRPSDPGGLGDEAVRDRTRSGHCRHASTMPLTQPRLKRRRPVLQVTASASWRNPSRTGGDSTGSAAAEDCRTHSTVKRDRPGSFRQGAGRARRSPIRRGWRRARAKAPLRGCRAGVGSRA